MALILRGTVVSGTGEAAGFVAIPWVRDAVRALAGFDPFPGTLNVLVSDAATLARWRSVRAVAGHRLAPPRPDDCGGRLIRVSIEPAIPAAVIAPDATRYGPEILEVLAPVHLRSALGLGDGDALTLALA